MPTVVRQSTQEGLMYGSRNKSDSARIPTQHVSKRVRLIFELKSIMELDVRGVLQGCRLASVNDDWSEEVICWRLLESVWSPGKILILLPAKLIGKSSGKRVGSQDPFNPSVSLYITP